MIAFCKCYAKGAMVEKNKHAERSGCPVACALDLVGDHWSLVIVRDLMFAGRHEYKDMLAAEEGISSNILVDRLKKLEAHGIIAAIPHPESRRRKLYYLTARGKGLVRVMVALVLWSAEHLPHAVRIPPDKQAFMALGPEEMVRLTLVGLDAWELEHGIDAQAT